MSTFPIMHLICPRRFCITFVFISPGYCSRPKRNWKQWLCKILGANKVHYGKCGSGAGNVMFYSLSAICTSPTRLVCPPKFFHNLTLYSPWVLQSSQEKLKTASANKGLLLKMWKWRVLPFSFFTFPLFTKRANLTRIYKIFITLNLINTGW